MPTLKWHLSDTLHKYLDKTRGTFKDNREKKSKDHYEKHLKQVRDAYKQLRGLNFEEEEVGTSFWPWKNKSSDRELQHQRINEQLDKLVRYVRVFLNILDQFSDADDTKVKTLRYDFNLILNSLLQMEKYLG